MPKINRILKAFVVIFISSTLMNIYLHLLYEKHDDRQVYSKQSFIRPLRDIRSNKRFITGHHYNRDRKTHEEKKRTQSVNRHDRHTKAERRVLRKRVKYLSKLSCNTGGDDDDVIDKMVYWKDIPSDAKYVNPLKSDSGEEKYLTFEPDEGGWNNVRMSMETVAAMAHAMGRTLVIPPPNTLYLMEERKRYVKGRVKVRVKLKQSNVFSIVESFPTEALAAEHTNGLKIITMDTFLKRMALSGKLLKAETKYIAFPPGNRTEWTESQVEDQEPLWKYLRSVADLRKWDGDACTVVFSSTPIQKKDLAHLQKIINLNEMSELSLPTPVFASNKQRFQEIRSDRQDRCTYDSTMQQSPVIHFSSKEGENRLLAHFYSFLFFLDWKQSLWYKRFIRDHFRYNDELQCAAATVIQAIRQRVSSSTNKKGIFHTMHVRRGDFQFKEARVEAKEILYSIQNIIPKNSTIYIATDEPRTTKFFQPLLHHYDIIFLHHFHHLIPNINTNNYGMLDQIIASKGYTFFGTYYSTFSAYIVRLRGYFSQVHQLEGFRDGTLPTTYYFLPEFRNCMHSYDIVDDPGWAREFPAAWRDIDYDVV